MNSRRARPAWRRLVAGVVIVVTSAVLAADDPAVFTPYADAQPILEALRGVLPDALTAGSGEGWCEQATRPARSSGTATSAATRRNTGMRGILSHGAHVPWPL